MNQEEIAKIANSNYSNSTPWPEEDIWHSFTFSSIKCIVEKWLANLATENSLLLNAGSGGTEYQAEGKLIHLDIVEKYICQFDMYIVGSIESISLPDSSIDGIICVGSVLNYADAQRSIAEFSRILKPTGFLIIEFERSNSAEFLWTKQYGKQVFPQKYFYNGQSHILWMYSEKHIRQILEQYGFDIRECKRIHSISSMLYRLGISEAKAAPYSKLDTIMQPFSYLFAHNVILLGSKNVFPNGNN